MALGYSCCDCAEPAHAVLESSLLITNNSIRHNEMGVRTDSAAKAENSFIPDSNVMTI